MDTPAGWYPDPLGRFDHRYWDGGSWTAHVARAGRQESDPLDSGGGPVQTTHEQVPGATTTSVPRTDEGEGNWAPPADAAPPVVTSPGPSTQPAGAWDRPAPTRTNVQAVLSLVFSLLWIGGLGSIAGIVLGVVGRRRISASGGRESGTGMAVAGIVIGALGLLGTALVTAAIAFFATTAPITFDPDSGIVLDEEQMLDDPVFRRWDLLYGAADAQELHRSETGGYTSDLDDLRGPLFTPPAELDMDVPIATDDEFCLELTDEGGTWHLDNDFYEVEAGACPLG